MNQDAINGAMLLVLIAELSGAVLLWNSPGAIEWLLAELHVRREMIPYIQRQRRLRIDETERRRDRWRKKLCGEQPSIGAVAAIEEVPPIPEGEEA